LVAMTRVPVAVGKNSSNVTGGPERGFINNGDPRPAFALCKPIH
jgi:hypothetical protein